MAETDFSRGGETRPPLTTEWVQTASFRELSQRSEELSQLASDSDISAKAVARAQELFLQSPFLREYARLEAARSAFRLGAKGAGEMVRNMEELQVDLISKPEVPEHDPCFGIKSHLQGEVTSALREGAELRNEKIAESRRRREESKQRRERSAASLEQVASALRETSRTQAESARVQQESSQRQESSMQQTSETLRQWADNVLHMTERQVETLQAQGRLGAEDKLDLRASSEDEERDMVRALLDSVENSNRDCGDYALSFIVRRLETSLELMYPGVAAEVRARLAVHDASELIKQANGWINERPKNDPGHMTIAGAFAEADRRGHSIEPGMVSLFLKKSEEGKEEGIKGLKIAKAWDLIEMANFNYRSFVRRFNYETIESFVLRKRLPQQDVFETFSIFEKIDFDWGGRQALSNKEMIWLRNKFTDKELDEELGALFSLKDLSDGTDWRETGKDPKNFFNDESEGRQKAVRQLIIDTVGDSKSFQLAEKLQIATLEPSVFNFVSRKGNDQLAEIVWMKTWRKDRAGIGRLRGPEIHVDKIEGFGSPWLRLQRRKIKGSEEDDPATPLLAKDIDFGKMKMGDWVYHGTIRVNRYQELRKLLLDVSPDPKDFNIHFLESAVPYFNNVGDREKKEKVLRTTWLEGVVSLALSFARLGWGQKSLDKLKKDASEIRLSNEAGTFITQEQWKWIERATGYGFGRLIQLEIRRASEGAR